MCARADRKPKSLRCAVLAAVLAAPAAFAQQTPSSGGDDAQAFRPSGPVTLTADRAEWVQGGEMKYHGHVSLQSDTLKLLGDEMAVKQFPDSQFEAQVTGTPARLDHAGRPGTEGIASQPVTAEAERMNYDSRAGVIQLNGHARLLRGSDEVTGEQIDYVIAERRIRAAGGQGGQVRIVIQPPANSAANGATPAPSPAPTPAPAPTPTPTPTGAVP